MRRTKQIFSGRLTMAEEEKHMSMRMLQVRNMQIENFVEVVEEGEKQEGEVLLSYRDGG